MTRRLRPDQMLPGVELEEYLHGHCPFGGPHRVRFWHNGKGVACNACKKTWEIVNGQLVSTYPNPNSTKIINLTG